MKSIISSYVTFVKKYQYFKFDPAVNEFSALNFYARSL